MIWRNFIRVLGLLLVLTATAVGWLGYSESGLVWGVQRLEVFLGKAFKVEQVQGTLLGQVTLRGLQVQIGKTSVAVDRLSLAVQTGSLFVGELYLRELHGQGLRIHFPETETDQSGQERVQAGPIDVVVPLPVRVDRFELLDIAFIGTTADEYLSVDRLSAAFDVQDRHLKLDELTLVQKKWQLALSGELNLQGDWTADMVGSFSGAHGPWDELSGLLQVHGSLRDLALDVELRTPFAVNMQGQLKGLPRTFDWQLDLDWQDAELAVLWSPLDGLAAGGKLALLGRGSDFYGNLQGQLIQRGGVEMPLSAELTADAKGLTVDVMKWEFPGGNVQGHGKLGWQQGLAWRAELSGSDFTPEKMFPAWPGRLNIDVVTSGSWKDGELRTEIDLHSLDGELRDAPFHVTGRSRFENGEWQISGLSLDSGENHILVKGSWSKVFDLEIEARCPQLTDLLPGGSGQLDLQGRVSGRPENLLLETEFTGAELSYQGLWLDEVDGSLALDLSPQGAVTGEVNTGRWQSGSLIIDSGRLELGGSRADHELRVDLQRESDWLSGAVRGGLQEKNWQGELVRLFWVSESLGEWQLGNPSPMTLARTGYTLAPLCMVSDGSGELCVEGDGDFSGTWQLVGQLEDVDLELFKFFTGHLDPLDGHARGTVRAAANQWHLSTLVGELQIPDLTLVDSLKEESTASFLKLAENNVVFDYDGEQLEAELGVGVQGQGHIQARAKIATGPIDLTDLTDLSKASLSGRVDVELPDVAVLDSLSQGLFLLTGHLGGRFDVDGSLDEPEFRGRLDLLDGQIQVPAAGIILEELNASMESCDRWLCLDLSAESGTGSLALEGRGRHDAQRGWLIQGGMRGRELLILNIPEYRLVADPDLRFNYADYLGRLSGRVEVVEGEIIFPSNQDGLSLSPDVVVVNGDLPSTAVGGESVISGRVTIGLGDAVQFQGFGLNGLLTGGLDIDFAGNRELTGSGSLSLDQGSFTFKGRTLDISRGRISYFETPLNNPAVDIRARRLVDHGEVGVLVSGTVEDMKYSLFSDPVMNERDALAKILAGTVTFGAEEDQGFLQRAAAAVGLSQGLSLLSELQQGFGIDDLTFTGGDESSPMSLMLGSRVASDLYLSYGYDLFNASSLFRASYDLGHGFSVVTEVNSLGTGADFLWSVER